MKVKELPNRSEGYDLQVVTWSLVKTQPSVVGLVMIGNIDVPYNIVEN
jgi:hypothetical protein